MFQSTRPRGARLEEGTDAGVTYRQFQSTRPRGARLEEGTDAGVTYRQFQSTRPRGARHDNYIYKYTPITVSIHAPAWGATQVQTLDGQDV